jgi:hypothetical protein
MSPNKIIYTFIVLIVIGVALYLIEAYIPMSPPIKIILRVVAIVFVLLWLLSLIGAF